MIHLRPPVVDDAAMVRIVDRPVAGEPGRHHITVSATRPGFAPRTATVTVTVPADAGGAEKLRWYLEDYAGFPTEPGPRMAAEAEQLLEAQGRELFTAAFGEGDARDLWSDATSGGLDRLRVEIDADPADTPGLPWELLRDRRGTKLAVQAGQFVRTHTQAARTRLPATNHELRVLLVICRPDGRADVPFRSVAARLVRGGVDRLDGLDLHVLRPATFARLATVLRAAHEEGQPYHVVHFDGHGTYLDIAASGERKVETSATRYGPSLAAPARTGRHGYLLFEKPGTGTNQELVDGPTLADLLVETQVPVLVLNACRSAYADAPPEPDPTLTEVHDRVRAYGSLAAEVADKGVAGVVAMRYNVYVVTAAQFVADLYTGLLAGRTLGQAAAAGRRALAADPARALGAEPVNLQDWMVPTVYEAAPTALVDRPAEASKRITLHAGDTGPHAGADVPAAPDIGFFGRDEALLALDRAFDTDRVVLLHALAGAGKTTTAAEFARWYLTTGGLRHDGGQGVVLWTSFEHHTPLERVLDAAGAVFAPLLEANDIHWDAITEPGQRRELILQIFAAVPVLWVWDNVEPVSGFPTGTPSAWTGDEQTELLAFLRDIRARTRAKVLLTSRRDEHAWLGDLPRRVRLAAMPMWESLQLVRALVIHLDASTDGIDWSELARFTGGNPLAIAVTVRQAVLREHVSTTGDVIAFLTRVQAGASTLEPTEHAELGRSASLAASLAYGFTHAFTELEHAQLATLHLFRDTVNIHALRLMGDPEIAGIDRVAGLAGMDGDSLRVVLSRASELGLLTEHGDGYYDIHPALPWFFTDLHTQHISDQAAAQRAYVKAYAFLGRFYFDRVAEGRAADVLTMLQAEDANLINALHLARAHKLLDSAIGCLQGLRDLYDLTGRNSEWAALVAAIQDDYIDPDTDLPRAGCEAVYSVVSQYRVQVARVRRDWPTAIRWQTIRTVWDRNRASPYLDQPLRRLNSLGRHQLQTLAIGEHLLGALLREQDDPACIGHLKAAHDLAKRLGATSIRADSALELGNAYLLLPGLYDLDRADQWYQRSLDLRSERDRIGRAVSYGSLATIAYKRLLEARSTGARTKKLVGYLKQAVTGQQQALELLPADHHEFRAAAHGQLGNVYSAFRQVSRALGEYQQAIRHMEARGDIDGAGRARYNIALLLQSDNRAGDALHYARAALANFQQVGAGAGDMTSRAEELIQELKYY